MIRIFAVRTVAVYDKARKEEPDMFEKKYRIPITEEEKTIIVKSLVALHNSQIEAGRYTDPVDDLIIRVSGLKEKKARAV